ncbi:MAG: hypothetical protein LBM70_07670 [Victivallales bacterium]|jgi:hypothetical protein|nr:hypothetical protein [Victivallales bacterium]
MKNVLFSAGLLALVMLFAHATYAGNTEELFTKIKIDLSSSNPPNLRNTGNNTTYSSSMSWRNRWLVIAVEFTPVAPPKMRRAWIDGATLSVRAMFNAPSESKKQTHVFSGKSVFWTIPLDAKKHIATMMIPPQLLDRYLPRTGSGSVASSSNAEVEAVFFDRDGAEIGRGYYSTKKWIVPKNAVEVPNSIFARNETPWSILDVDYFDLLQAKGTPVAAIADGGE